MLLLLCAICSAASEQELCGVFLLQYIRCCITIFISSQGYSQFNSRYFVNPLSVVTVILNFDLFDFDCLFVLTWSKTFCLHFICSFRIHIINCVWVIRLYKVTFINMHFSYAVYSWDHWVLFSCSIILCVCQNSLASAFKTPAPCCFTNYNSLVLLLLCNSSKKQIWVWKS